MRDLFGIAVDSRLERTSRRASGGILPIYGIGRVAGSFSILGYILSQRWRSLLEGRHTTQLLVVARLVGMKFRRRFRRMFAKSSYHRFPDVADFDTPENTSPIDQAVLTGKRGAFRNARKAAVQPPCSTQETAILDTPERARKAAPTSPGAWKSAKPPPQKH